MYKLLHPSPLTPLRKGTSADIWMGGRVTPVIHIAPPLYREGHIPKGGSVFPYRNASPYACPGIYSLTDSFPYPPFQGNKPRRACASPHIYVEPLNRK
ncbi:hypothetical protein EII32_09425 [Prevotella sp. OH937_COT-195]|nr:hypothetical protein EII32_09425 [Prevotella sp. OH937_COT-195]